MFVDHIFYIKNISNDTGKAKVLVFETEQKIVQLCKTLFGGKEPCCSSLNLLITCYF